MSRLRHKYLRPDDLRRLRYLVFSSRRPMEGLYAGRHASPQRGHSVEFTDYRQYMPGDEPADIDWKVYGRTDKLFLKLFEHQSDMAVHLLVDGSASMAYAGMDEPRRLRRPGEPVHRDGPRSKYDHACRIAAAIAFLVTRQQDKASFGVAQSGLAQFVRPQGSAKGLMSILEAMERVTPRGRATLAEALREHGSRVPRRGLFVLISDLLDEPAPVLKELSTLAARGSEVLVFHVLHADELHLPDLDAAVFTDSESGRRMTLHVDDVRPAYHRRLHAFLQQWSKACRGRGFDYVLTPTDKDYQRAIEHYLVSRSGKA